MKIEKTTILAFVAVTFIFGLLTKANANLIVNGSFEDGIDPGVFLPLPGGSTAIAGWITTGVSTDYIGTVWVASDGERSLDLVGSPGLGGVMQTFATTPGAGYIVTFDLAGNPRADGLPPVTSMRVEAAGQSADYSYDTTGKDYQNMGWVTRSWRFTANSTSTTLEFYALDARGSLGELGNAIDNVSVVPEPATICLLGLGALSLLRKRRA